MKILMAKCKRRIATLWFTGAGALFFLLLFQTVFGRYGDKARDAWSWFLPSVIPTLSLITAVLVMDALNKAVRTVRIDRFVFRLSYSLSAIYLFVVALTILLQPFAPLPPLELLKQSNLWLGPFQGLVTASLGAFFVKRELA